jgi:hypothetical protein
VTTHDPSGDLKQSKLCALVLASRTRTGLCLFCASVSVCRERRGGWKVPFAAFEMSVAVGVDLIVSHSKLSVESIHATIAPKTQVVWSFKRLLVFDGHTGATHHGAAPLCVPWSSIVAVVASEITAPSGSIGAPESICPSSVAETSILALKPWRENWRGKRQSSKHGSERYTLYRLIFRLHTLIKRFRGPIG